MVADDRSLAKWALYSEFFRFTQEQEASLLELAGYDHFSNKIAFLDSVSGLTTDEAKEEESIYNKSMQFLTNIRFYLGLFDEAVKKIDNAPTQKDISEEFMILRQAGYNFFDQLIKIRIDQKTELELEGFEIDSLEKSLASFITVATKIAFKSTNESRGRKKAITRKAIINHLAVEFDKYCIGENTEKSKIEFINLALNYAGIVSPKNLKRLFYRPGEKQVYFKQIQ